ncbi:hypothetical protein [Anaeromyxobacter diazotrophicus]|uniref:J domain-containing protein n=1 Tax=Anaeromyxobacter diazotrophicus TaxID=2590199 RepID=A0A7I9VKM2_9BACT|nr:hypothetical protein [Anaeromyxobacter diazotrophicus]GEJ56964.1 hypothetical protein AMYX_17050 [Anaeromyxobacter diazotrophicus]
MPRILLVDDDLAEIAAVKRALAGAGHQTVLATNASDALAAVAGGAADAALVAPECDGGEGAAVLRAMAARGTPAAALPRPLDARAAVEVASALAASPRRPRAPAPSPSAAGTREPPSTSGSGSPTATATRTAAPSPAPTANRPPAFDTSSSASAEAVELRQAERELWWKQEQRSLVAAATPAAPAPSSPPPAAPPRRRPLDRGWVEEMLRQAEQADYFDLVGLPPDCSREDVLQAAGRLLEELAPERVPPSDAILLDKVEEIRRVLAEARDVLADDPLREAYRRALGR